MMGVMVTLGNLKEKNRLVEEPNIENIMASVHMRGVFIERERSSVGATDARTWAYGESSDGRPFDFKSCSSSLSEDSSSSPSGPSTVM